MIFALLLDLPIAFRVPMRITRSLCGRGEIGRRARFRFWYLKDVGVQVPPPAPKS